MLPANLGTALRDLSRKLPSDPVICFHHRTTHGTGDCSCFRTKSLASNTDAEGLRKDKKKGPELKKLNITVKQLAAKEPKKYPGLNETQRRKSAMRLLYQNVPVLTRILPGHSRER